MTQMNVMLNQKLPQDQLMAKYTQIFAQAKTNADLAVAANSASYQNYIARGSLYENIMSLGVKGAYDLAKKNYTDALARNPQGPDMDLALARMEIGNNNLTEAEKDLEAALALKKDYVDAIYLQSQLYAQRGFLDTAISKAQLAAQLAPNDPGVLFQLGYLQYRNADYRDAAATMQAAVNITPNYANALYFLGLSLNKLGMNDKALQVFAALQQSNPDSTEVTGIIANLKAGKDALAGADTTTTKEATPATTKK
jgi:tetratricopeptide (TPR) repeat protein